MSDETQRSPIGSPGLEWRPQPSPGGWIGGGATLLLLLCSVAAWGYVASRPLALDGFVAAVAGLAAGLLAVVAGVLSYGYYSMRYYLDDRELTITWLGIRETVPLACIEGVYRGDRLGKQVQVDGVSWPGYQVGNLTVEGLGRVTFYGTTNKHSEAVVVATPRRIYALTPPRQRGFRRRLVDRLEALSDDDLQRAPDPIAAVPRLLTLSFLRDGVAVALLGVALVVLLGSFGYVSARMPSLPELMPLHFNFAGEPDFIGPPRDALRMPMIGLLILGANGALSAAIHEGRRDASRILAAATLFVQVVMLIAVLRVVH